MYRHYAYSLRTKKKKKRKGRCKAKQRSSESSDSYILFQRTDSRTTKFPLIYLYDIDIDIEGEMSALNDFWVAKGG